MFPRKTKAPATRVVVYVYVHTTVTIKGRHRVKWQCVPKDRDQTEPSPSLSREETTIGYQNPPGHPRSLFPDTHFPKSPTVLTHSPCLEQEMAFIPLSVHPTVWAGFSRQQSLQLKPF